MITKFLVIGDPHFKTSNLPDTDDFINKTIDLATKESPDYIIILGDVLHEHERLHTIPLNKAYEFIKAMTEAAPTYVMVGNHDLINNQQFLTENHWMNGMKEWDNVTIVDVPIVLNHNDSQFILCPYVPNGRLQEALDTDETIDWKSASLIFVHQEFMGCKMGAIISQDGDVWNKSLPPVISGHIHSNQTLLDGHIYYPGSAMQNAFGDPNNTLSIIEYDPTIQISPPYVCREIDLMLRKKKIVYVDMESIDTFDISKVLNSQDDIKLSLTGSYDDFKIFIKTPPAKELLNNGIKIVHKNKKQIRNHDADDADDAGADVSAGDDESADEDADGNPTIFNSDDSLEKLIHSFVTREANSYVTSDFNHVFLGYEKDSDLLLL